ncbi:MAG: ATP-dependent Clp protease ATP-binding subunit ClpC, partial [Planctomycetota bacterium]
FGARPLKRGIEKLLEDPLSEQILKGKLGEPYSITANLDGDDVAFDMVKRPVVKKEEEGEKAAATPAADATSDSDDKSSDSK